MKNTIDDFWQMVWDSGAQVIVGLGNVQQVGENLRAQMIFEFLEHAEEHLPSVLADEDEGEVQLCRLLREAADGLRLEAPDHVGALAEADRHRRAPNGLSPAFHRFQPVRNPEQRRLVSR